MTPYKPPPGFRCTNSNNIPNYMTNHNHLQEPLETGFMAIRNNLPETVAALKRHRFTLNPFRYLFQKADRAYILAAADYAFYMRMTHYNIGRPNYDICREQLDLTRTALLRASATRDRRARLLRFFNF